MRGFGMMKFIEWLRTPARIPRAERRRCLLWAHYWNGGSPTAVEVSDISTSGAFLHSQEQWYPGTILNITIQYEFEMGQGEPPHAITLPCRVVRHGRDGMGVAFVAPTSRDRRQIRRFLRSLPANVAQSMAAAEAGQSLVEFALMVPLLFVIIFNAVNFGGFLYAWITVTNAARVGGQSAAMGAAYASYPATASLSTIKTLIQNETASLPGASATNPVVTACANLNGSSVQYPPTTPAVACPAGVTAPPTDPETITGLSGSSTYTTVAVDVTYTYTPLITPYSGRMGIASPPTSLHRRTVMRILN